jgi:hypothetical protein
MGRVAVVPACLDLCPLATRLPARYMHTMAPPTPPTHADD